VTQILATVLLVLSGFFLLVSTVGILRLPDFFSRAHAVGKSETLGALLFLVGISLHAGLTVETAKLFLILFLVAVTNPTGVHTLTRAALRKGMDIWTEEDPA
jgi:multicomponent Na+:H+ antiporter subunit G